MQASGQTSITGLSTTPNTSFLDDANDLANQPVETSKKMKNGIAERLQDLRPSRQLLEFYRNKMAEYDDEHSEIFEKINHIEVICDANHRLENEIQNRERDISNLQKALRYVRIWKC